MFQPSSPRAQWPWNQGGGRLYSQTMAQFGAFQRDMSLSSSQLLAAIGQDPLARGLHLHHCQSLLASSAAPLQSLHAATHAVEGPLLPLFHTLCRSSQIAEALPVATDGMATVTTCSTVPLGSGEMAYGPNWATAGLQLGTQAPSTDLYHAEHPGFSTMGPTEYLGNISSQDATAAAAAAAPAPGSAAAAPTTKYCHNPKCGAGKTPQWRKGPNGEVCNACGMWATRNQGKQRDPAALAAQKKGKSAGSAVTTKPKPKAAAGKGRATKTNNSMKVAAAAINKKTGRSAAGVQKRNNEVNMALLANMGNMGPSALNSAPGAPAGINSSGAADVQEPKRRGCRRKKPSLRQLQSSGVDDEELKEILMGGLRKRRSPNFSSSHHHHHNNNNSSANNGRHAGTTTYSGYQLDENNINSEDSARPAKKARQSSASEESTETPKAFSGCAPGGQELSDEESLEAAAAGILMSLCKKRGREQVETDGPGGEAADEDVEDPLPPKDMKRACRRNNK